MLKTDIISLYCCSRITLYQIEYFSIAHFFEFLFLTGAKYGPVVKQPAATYHNIFTESSY